MPTERVEAPGNRWRRAGWWLLLALVAGLVAIAYALGWMDRLSFEQLRQHHDELRAWTWDHLVLALLLFLCGYTISATLPFPATFFHLAAGALLGLWPGYAVVVVTTNIAAVAAFLLSRYLVGDVLQRRWGDRLQVINRGIARDGAYYLLTLRLVPAFPFFLINGLMGLTRLPLSTYAGVSFVGMLPVSLVYVYTGAQLENIHAAADILSPRVLLAFTGLGLLPLVLRLLIPRGREPANREGTAAEPPRRDEPSSAVSETP
jgi:uncharacterized membrane protein YdjX (TVP38/TMEM64 family)